MHFSAIIALLILSLVTACARLWRLSGQPTHKPVQRPRTEMNTQVKPPGAPLPKAKQEVSVSKGALSTRTPNNPVSDAAPATHYQTPPGGNVMKSGSSLNIENIYEAPPTQFADYNPYDFVPKAVEPIAKELFPSMQSGQKAWLD